MKRRNFLKYCASTAGASLITGSLFAAGGMTMKNQTMNLRVGKKLPNIIFIMADDLGYGDVNCLNTNSDKIPTPNIDRLAAKGMIFTDSHSGSAVCTPTRYGVVTGRYCWRTYKKSGVLNGYSKLLVDTNRMTVASMLKKHGYQTACIGKWHLGMGSSTRSTTDFINNNLSPGPNELGFDYWFGIPASLDMSPYVYIENGQCTRPPTGSDPGSSSPRFWRSGPIAEDFDHDDVMPKITEKTVAFINNHCKQQPDNPFFLYFPLSAPHTPYLPLAGNDGRSQAGIYGDFVTLCDWTVGQVVKAVEKNGQHDNTLIIVSSDNGCHESSAKTANYGHNSNHIYRGQKADIWDGGHRVPFITQWPGKVQADSNCGQPICHTDLMATFAEIVGYKLPDNAGEDSFSFLSYLLGTTPTVQTREAIVHHSISGGFAIRKGKWKFIDGTGSMGWSGSGDGLPGQLYDMEVDPDESSNFYESPNHQTIIQELKILLETYKSQGYSRPL